MVLTNGCRELPVTTTDWPVAVTGSKGGIQYSMAFREITIGLPVSLTGKYCAQGRQVFEAVNLFVGYVNKEGGLQIGSGSRLPVKLIHRDDRSRTGVAEEIVGKLLDEDRVDILFGPYSSGLTMAAARIAQQRGKVLWNHGGSSDEIFKQGWRYLVSAISPASDYFRHLPRLLLCGAPALKRLCIIKASNSKFAAHIGRGLSEGAEESGFEPPQEISFHSPIADPGTIIERLSDLEPDALVLAGSFQDDVSLVKQRHLFPKTIRRIAAVAAGVQAFAEELGPYSNEVIGPSQWEPTVEHEKIIGPDCDWFAQNFKERYGKPPDYMAAGAFAVGIILQECARRAGSLIDDDLRQVAAELDIHTLYGRFKIDPETGRQVGHKIHLVQWQDGRSNLLLS